MPDVPGDEPEGGRPWERPGAVRRDALLHRGHWLRVLGWVAFVLGLLSFFLLVTALPGYVVGTFGLHMADADLARMAAGTMDPRGRGETEAARRLARGARGMSVPGPLACISLWWLLSRH
jgi:hypothetical protein